MAEGILLLCTVNQNCKNETHRVSLKISVPVYDSKESSSRGYSNIKVLSLVIQEVELNDLRISLLNIIYLVNNITMYQDCKTF